MGNPSDYQFLKFKTDEPEYLADIDRMVKIYNNPLVQGLIMLTYNLTPEEYSSFILDALSKMRSETAFGHKNWSRFAESAYKHITNTPNLIKKFDTGKMFRTAPDYRDADPEEANLTDRSKSFGLGRVRLEAIPENDSFTRSFWREPGQWDQKSLDNWSALSTLAATILAHRDLPKYKYRPEDEKTIESLIYRASPKAIKENMVGDSLFASTFLNGPSPYYKHRLEDQKSIHQVKLDPRYSNLDSTKASILDLMAEVTTRKPASEPFSLISKQQ